MSSELYHIKQQFTLSAHKSLIETTLPSPSSPEFIPTLVYQARAHIALGNPSAAEALVTVDSEDITLKAVAALARYFVAGIDDKDAPLEELRDLCVELEGDAEGDKDLVKVLAATAFAQAGEVEEALETLGPATETEHLETIAFIVQIYLSIHRPDLAKKAYDSCKNWAEDDLLLQLIESSIGLVTGKESYSNPHSFYTEQLGNPSLSSPHLLTARGVTRLLQGEVPAANSDLEDAQSQQKDDPETFVALCVAAGLLGNKHKTEANDIFSQLSKSHPSHPFVTDSLHQADLFDTVAAKYQVPALAA